MFYNFVSSYNPSFGNLSYSNILSSCIILVFITLPATQLRVLFCEDFDSLIKLEILTQICDATEELPIYIG